MHKNEAGREYAAKSSQSSLFFGDFRADPKIDG
jgi:hypothetical protein